MYGGARLEDFRVQPMDYVLRASGLQCRVALGSSGSRTGLVRKPPKALHAR